MHGARRPEPARVRPARGRAVLTIAMLASWPLAMATVLISTRGGAATDAVSGLILLAYSVVGCAAAGVAARDRSLDHRTRRAWLMVSVGLALAAVACLLFARGGPFPGPGDYVRLALDPFLFAGLLTFPLHTPTGRNNQRLALDVGIVVAGGFIFLWYLSLGPAIVASGVPADVGAVAIAYPLLDLALVVAASTALMRGAAAESRPLLLLATGLYALVVADVQHGSQALRSTAASVRVGGTLEWASLISAFFLIALAAVEQCRVARRHTLAAPTEQRVRATGLLPYVAVMLGFTLLLVVAFREGVYPWGGLIVGAIVMTACVLGRQIVTLRENHTLVVTDHLTGLASRPELRAAAAQALTSAKRSGTAAALLVIDLDGFKKVNDTLGHEAGDELLVAFAALLRRTMSRSDTVARMGGDEFAVVLPAVGSLANASRVVERIIAELEKPVTVSGRQMRLRASIGIAMSRPEATIEELLRQADQAMYLAKRRQSTGWAWHPLAALPAVGVPAQPAAPVQPAQPVEQAPAR